MARAETPAVDPPTLPTQIVPPQATSSPQPAAVDAPEVLTRIVPPQATGSPEPAKVDAPTLPAQVVLPQNVSPAADTTTPPTEVLQEPLTDAPTEPLRIVAPLDDPEPSTEPRTAPMRIVAPETSDDERAERQPDSADTPTPRSIPAADALKDKAGALLGQ